EIAPLAYMRGRTLNNAFVILDEAQNATYMQMKMFLTRIGFNSRAIITGDITQTDLPRKKQSGLISIQHILKDIEGISFVYLEIAPLAYMRGRTLNNAFVILDEAQNATNMQMKMFLTRIGFNSRAIITGDITQTDLPRKKQSGLISIQHILKDIEGISFVYLDKKDVVRHRLVREIIEAYDRHEDQQ